MRTPALLLALAVLAAPAAAGVFRCQDAAGHVAYQGEPCDGGARQSEVRLRDDRIDPGAQPRASQWAGFTPPKVAAITFYYDPADEPVGFSSQQMEADIRAAMAAMWGTGEFQHAMNPDMPWNEEIRATWARQERLALSPAAVLHS